MRVGKRMRVAAVLAMLLAALLSGTRLAAQGGKPQGLAEAAIRATMTEQVAAWNRGDIDGFMRGYANSPETTFIGSTVAQGYAPILERYHKAYATRAQMGTLRFEGLAVRMLPCANGGVEYAVVTGRFHLTRLAHGAAAKDDGVFSLLWHREAGGWKIILDHTS